MSPNKIIGDFYFNNQNMKKAIALFSGGLDSTLSILAMKKQGIEVIGVIFVSLFGCKSTEDVIRKNEESAKKFGFKLIIHNFTEEQFKIIKEPVYGLGKNLNPCMDCHILMLKEAKKIMISEGADFVVTGEVIGQRPKSQRRDTFPVIDRDAGLEGLVLRPLSALNLEPTIPEIEGWVDREQLHKIGGRGRKMQISIAKSIGWEDFPSPAGGCLLTDVGYSKRLTGIIKNKEMPEEIDVILTPIGRHFKAGESRIISGRNKEDNDRILEIASVEDILIQAIDCGSPLTIIRGEDTQKQIKLAAEITARYSDKKMDEIVNIRVFNKGGKEEIIEVKPAKNEDLLKIIIA